MSDDVSTDCRRPFFSRFWLFVSPSMDKCGTRDLRRQLLAELQGEVVEVGAGNGLNADVAAHHWCCCSHVIKGACSAVHDDR